MPEQGSNELLIKDGRVRVQISTDRMEAYLMIDPPVGDGRWPTKEDALLVLQSENVIFGIVDGAVEEAIRTRSKEPYLVAKGKAPIPGKDAELKFLFGSENADTPYQEDQFGRVDYRNITTVENVRTGQVLLEKIPATAGEPGYNVHGRQLAPVRGKDKIIQLGNNVTWDEQNLKVISKIDGEPSFSLNKLNVYPIHEVNGDVNFKSGNISFLGSVIVRGNVDSGFKVEADGDVTIHGTVEAADIKAGGNITIYGGVSGLDKSEIFCGGNLTAKYIEHATLTCGGSVVVKEAIMHCQVNADQKIIVDLGKGLIVGGVLRAGEEIAAKIIGSKFGTVTELEVGVKPKTKIEYQELESKIHNLKLDLDKVEKALSMLERLPYLTPEKQDMKQNLVKTSYVLKGQIAEAEARRKAILEDMVVLSREKARVKVKDTIFPGVRISIGKATSIIKDELKFLILQYNDGEIQIQPYK